MVSSGTSEMNTFYRKINQILIHEISRCSAFRVRVAQYERDVHALFHFDKQLIFFELNRE